jgi:hypothetical protein
MGICRLVGKPYIYLATHSRRNRYRLEESGIAEKLLETILPSLMKIKKTLLVIRNPSKHLMQMTYSNFTVHLVKAQGSGGWVPARA